MNNWLVTANFVPENNVLVSQVLGLVKREIAETPHTENQLVVVRTNDLVIMTRGDFADWFDGEPEQDNDITLGSVTGHASVDDLGS